MVTLFPAVMLMAVEWSTMMLLTKSMLAGLMPRSVTYIPEPSPPVLAATVLCRSLGELLRI